MTVPPRPRGFVFEVTASCDHDCPHCYNVWKNPGVPVPPDADLDLQTRILDRALDLFGHHVTLTGGEPLLVPHLPELVDRLHARGIPANLITNGSRMDDAMIARLAGKVAIFEIPLLSADRAVHDLLSGRDGAFDRATCAIASLKAAGQRVVAVFVATARNVAGFPEALELAFALGADGLMFNRMNPGGAGLANPDLLPDPPSLVAALAHADAFCERHDYFVSCSIAMPPCLFDRTRHRRIPFGFCAAGTDRAYYTVDPVGFVRPCNHSRTVLGNVLADSFEALTKGEPMRRFLDAHPAFCASCAHLHDCRGNCKAAGEAACGDPCALDPYVARFAPGASAL